PALRRPVADALDHAERLVPGHDGQADGQDARVLLRVAPADAARLDTQQRAVVVDVGDGQLAQLEAARRGLHDGAARPHGASNPRAPRRVQALAPEPVLDDDWGRACSATAAGRPSRASGCRSAASARVVPRSSTAAGTATITSLVSPTTAASPRPSASPTRSRGISATGSARRPQRGPRRARARAGPAPPSTRCSGRRPTATTASPGLERLCRYVLRPPVAQDRLALPRRGRCSPPFRRANDPANDPLLAPASAPRRFEQFGAAIAPARIAGAFGCVSRSPTRRRLPSVPRTCAPLIPDYRTAAGTA